MADKTERLALVFCEAITNKRSRIKELGMVPKYFRDLKKGDIFSLHEPDGIRVENKDGDVVFAALSDAFEKDGVWTIDCDRASLSCKADEVVAKLLQEIRTGVIFP